MKLRASVLLLSVGFVLAGCGRVYGPVKQVEALMEAKAEVIDEIDKKVEESPNESGVDQARRVFDERKEKLTSLKKAIDESPKGSNFDWQTTLWKSEERDDKAFEAIRSKFGAACWQVECEAAREKLSKLEDDFKKTVR